MTLYYKIWQMLLQNGATILLQNATNFYFLLQNATVLLHNTTVFTNDKKCYSKRRHLLQNLTFITNCDSSDHMGHTLHLVQWWIIQVKPGGPAEHLYVSLCILYFMYMLSYVFSKKSGRLKSLKTKVTYFEIIVNLKYLINNFTVYLMKESCKKFWGVSIHPLLICY